MNKALRGLIICLLIIAISTGFARAIETDFGKVSVENIKIQDEFGNDIAVRLYKPKSATEAAKAPAVLNIHGYQNDKLTDDSMAIELSRRGFVVLSADQLGHGDSAPKFDLAPVFTGQSTLGMNSVYQYAKVLPYVDATNMGVMGHSLGAILTLSVGAMNPDVRALNPQCGTAGTPDMKNLLLTQARYDEFSLFREGLLTVDDLPTNPARLQAFGLTGQVEWDKLYGDFAAGTARKATLVNMEHHFLPLTQKAVTEAVDWMQNSLIAGQSKMDPGSHVYWWKALLGLVSLLAAIFMLIPLTNLFLATEFFKPVSQIVPSGYVVPQKKWWVYAIINFLIGGITYPIFTQWSALSDKYQAIFPWLRLQVGNGVFVWLLVNAVISAILFTIWYRQTKKAGQVQLKDLGVVSSEEEKKQGVLGKTILLAVILFLCLYLVQALFQIIFKQEIRFVWPFMRQFSSFTRVGLFLLYLIPAIAFWLINGGLFLFGQMHLKEESSPSKTQWVWWAKACFAFLTGLLIVWMIQYLPWYLANAGPGFELLKLPQFSALWPLMLQVYIPEFLILIWILVWFYRRTGRIYLGALMVSSLMIWFLAAGSVVAK